ncbi:MAG TPA: MFS transporter [Thermomicrobiales bacterium]|nr:MFS transporter [Thermomicrobiales bacterium]
MRRRGLWAHADFFRLWTASTVSIFGTLITRTALPFAAILVLGAGPLALGALSIAQLLPAFAIGLVAGAWVDRLRRRPIMIAADLGRAALLATIPAAAVGGVLTLPHLYLVAFATSALSVFFDVAYQSYLPSLVGRADLIEGNAKLTAAGAVAEAGAFSVGGVLVQALTAPIAILVDAVSFLWSAFLIGRIAAPEPSPRGSHAEPQAANLRREIGDGLRAVRNDAALLALAGSSTLVQFTFGVGGTIYLLYVNQELGFSPGVLGVIFAAGGVSSLTGALVAGRLTRFGIGAVMIAALLLGSVGQALAPLAGSVGMAAAAALLVAQQLISDSAITVYDIHDVSLRQALAPERVLGRVVASIKALEAGAMLAGALLGGILGERAGLRPTLFLSAGVMALAAVWLALSPVRNIRRTPEPAAEAADIAGSV